MEAGGTDGSSGRELHGCWLGVLWCKGLVKPVTGQVHGTAAAPTPGYMSNLKLTEWCPLGSHRLGYDVRSGAEPCFS
jgi:hypothetical protein